MKLLLALLPLFKQICTAHSESLIIRDNSSRSFVNPVLYEDYADNDISVGPDGVYYYSASNMHFSPGAPILQSYDLVNWELIGHSVPSLDFGSKYNLTDGQAYRGGTWASTLRYRTSNKTWYWIGCIDFWSTYIYTASAPAGPWTRHAVLPGGTCYYDCGLLIDDDDSMYVVYGPNNVTVAQLSSNATSEMRSQIVGNFSLAGAEAMEGNRFYKRGGLYYILNDDPDGVATYVWKSESPFGPYTSKRMVSNQVKSPVAGASTPIQGSLIETNNGDWYFMSFTWAYPLGRMPVLAPITWAADGFPVLSTNSSGDWAPSYLDPLPYHKLPLSTGKDTFNGTSLGVQWEWNHNPDPSKYNVDDGLTLNTATVTDDLFAARNTLTRRLHGEFPIATLEVDFAGLSDGDHAGLSVFRDVSSSIGAFRNQSAYELRVVTGMTQDEVYWNTTSTGNVVATADLTDKKVWLRASLDSRAAGSHKGTFEYSTDGRVFTSIGPMYDLSTDYRLFQGYRFAIFNYATKALGGSIKVSSFTSS